MRKVNLFWTLGLLTASFAATSALGQSEPLSRPDDGTRDRRLKLPSFLEEVTTPKNEAPRIEKPKEEIKPLRQPALKRALIEEKKKPETDEQGLRQTLIDSPSVKKREPVKPRGEDDGDQRFRLRNEEVARAGGVVAAKKAPVKTRITGPTTEMRPHHPMAQAANSRTGVAPLKVEKTAEFNTKINSSPQKRTTQRRVITVEEAALMRRNSMLRPLARVVPAKPYEVPLDRRMTAESGRMLPVANPLARGAITDPITGSIIMRAPVLREISQTGLSLLSKDQGVLRPFSLDNDAYMAQGVRQGNFIYRPSFDLSTGFDSNPLKTSSANGGSFFSTARGAINVQSDFTRHSFAADISGSATAFTSHVKSFRPDLTAKLAGRLDIRHHQTLDVEARYRLNQQSNDVTTPGVTVQGEPLTHVLGAGTAYNIDFNRLTVSLKGAFDRTQFEDVNLSDNTTLSGSDRHFNTGRVALRGSFRHSEELRPFVEVFAEKRQYDVATKLGLLQGSNAIGAKAGVRFEKNKRLTGEFAVGFAQRDNFEPTLADLRGLIFDAAVVWAATGLTNVTVKAGSSFDESVLTGVSTIYRRDVSIQVDHAFRRYLIGSAKVGFGYDSYEGTSRVDNRIQLSAGLNYRFTRDVSVSGELRHEKTTTTGGTGGYSANIVMVGVKLQR